MGVTEGARSRAAVCRLADGSPEGVVWADGQVIGTYITPYSPTTGNAWHGWGAFAGGAVNIANDAAIEQTLDAFAAHLAAHLDLDRCSNWRAEDQAATVSMAIRAIGVR